MSWLAAGLAVVAALVVSGCGKQESAYPNKPIQLVVPFAAGGGTDVLSRALAEALKPILGQDVVVVNKPGGSGAVGMSEVLQSQPDGYTLTMATVDNVKLPLMGTVPFKTFDFRYISLINLDPAVVVVKADSKYKTIGDLVSDIKANPGKLNFAAPNSPNEYSIAWAQAADLDFVTIPFQGTALAIVEVLGGRADFGIYGVGEVVNHIQGGGVRPLAIMAEKRLPGFYKDVPTMKEAGMDVISATYRGLAAPKGTPDEIATKLDNAVAKAVKDPKFVEFTTKQNIFIEYRNENGYNAFLNENIKKMEPIIERAKQMKLKAPAK